MSTSILLTLAACALLPQKDGFADLAPELELLHARDPLGAYVVPAPRVGEIEARLAAFLELPLELGVSLSRSGIRSDQRYPLSFGHFGTQLVLRSTGLELGSLQLTLDGEQVRVGTLTFVDPAGVSVATRRQLRNGRPFVLADLASFHRALLEVLRAFERDDVELVSFEPQRRLEQDPSFAAVRFAARVGAVEVLLQTALRVGTTPAEPVEPAAPAPPPARRSLDQGLDGVTALAGQLTFAFPHSARLIGRSEASDDYVLLLGPRTEPHRHPTIEVALLRDSESAFNWKVVESSARLREEALGLGPFVALTNRALALAAAHGERIVAFGAFFDEASGEAAALVLTLAVTPTPATTRGRIAVLSAAPEGEARVVAEDELSTIEKHTRSEFRATTRAGHVLQFARDLFPCVDDAEYDEQLLMRYRGWSAPLMSSVPPSPD